MSVRKSFVNEKPKDGRNEYNKITRARIIHIFSTTFRFIDFSAIIIILNKKL